MLVRRINPICIRAQQSIHRYHRFLLASSIRQFSNSGSSKKELPDNGASKTETAKNDLLSRLAPPQKKKIDFKKKAIEIGAMTWEATKYATTVIYDHARHPSKIPVSARYAWQLAKAEAHHYWVIYKPPFLDCELECVYMLRLEPSCSGQR